MRDFFFLPPYPTQLYVDPILLCNQKPLLVNFNLNFSISFFYLAFYWLVIASEKLLVKLNITILNLINLGFNGSLSKLELY